MHWRNYRNIGLAILSTIVILFSGIAYAQTQGGDIVEFGGSVTVPENQTVNDAVAIGGTVTVQKGARVTGNAVAIGGGVTLAPNVQVSGDAIGIGGPVTVESGAFVQGDTAALGGDVVLRSGAKVGRDASAVGGKLVRDAGATVGGGAGTVFDGMQERQWHAPIVFYIFNALWRLLTALLSAVIGVVLLLWRPHFLPKLAEIIQRSPGATALWGLGGALALIGINIVLAISLVGIPLLPLLNSASVLAVLVGSLAIALLIGQRIPQTLHRPPIQQLLIGVLILALIGFIPVLGGLCLLMINIVGLGAVLIWLIKHEQPHPVI